MEALNNFPKPSLTTKISVPWKSQYNFELAQNFASYSRLLQGFTK